MINTIQEFAQFFHGHHSTIYRQKLLYTNKSGQPDSCLADIELDDIQKNIETKCIYFLPNIGGTCNSEIFAFPAFYIDLDRKDRDRDEFKATSLKIIKDFPLTPTFIIDTKNGYHCYWVLSLPLYGSEGEYDQDRTKWRVIQRALAQHFRSDTAICSPHQPMRLPFTNHLKDPNDKYWISIIGGSSCKYSVEQITDAVESVIEAPLDFTKKKHRARRQPTPRSQNRGNVFTEIHPDNLILQALKDRNADAVKQMLQLPEKVVTSAQDFHDYVTKEFDLHEFFGGSGKSFCCPFHNDSHSSASIFPADNAGEWLFKCFTCDIVWNIRTLTQYLTRYSKAKTTTFLSEALSIKWQETEWQKKWKEDYRQQTDRLATIESNYPDLFKCLKRLQWFYEDMVEYASMYITNEHSTASNGRPIFFASFDSLGKNSGIRDPKAVGCKVAMLSLLKLVRRIPETEIPTELLEASMKHRGMTDGSSGPLHRMVTYFEICDLSEDQLTAANERAALFLSSSLTPSSISRDAIIRTFGSDIANEVYEQGETVLTKRGDKAQELITSYIESYVYQNGYCLESDLVRTLCREWNTGETQTRKRMKGALTSALSELSLQRRRLTNEIRTDYKIAVKGAKTIYVPVR